MPSVDNISDYKNLRKIRHIFVSFYSSSGFIFLNSNREYQCTIVLHKELCQLGF